MDPLEAARASRLVPGGEPLLVLLSGGADSVCLLGVAVELGARVSALHVNYGLRDGADADEAHCRDLCGRLGVPLVAEPVTLPGTGNLQAEAREARYALAERHAKGDYAAAHTASDQAETVLYRLATSPGRRALLGMEPRRGRLVRPLLDCTRDDTRAWCRERGLRWREDPSNEDPRFARSRVRHGLLRALREVAPGAERTIAETARGLRDEHEVLEAVTGDALAALGGPGVPLPQAELRALPLALARLVLRRAAGAPLAGADAEALLTLGGGRGSASLDLGDGLRAVAEYGLLRFTRARGTAGPDPVPLAVPGTARFGDWEVRAGGPLAAAEVWLAGGELGPVVTVRGWREGDRMRPAGLGGTKSLQDLFTDRKVPRELRRALPVVEARGEIAWVAGVAVGERFRADPSAPGAVALSARRIPHAPGREQDPRGGILRGGNLPHPMRDSRIGQILVQQDELAHRVREIGRAVSADYAGRDLLMIGVLKGAVFFLSDLMRHVDVPCEVDFMAVSSYGSSTDSSGVVRILKDLDVSIEGREVLLVEDIVDSGLTLSYLLRTLKAREPASLEVCALLTKPERRKVDLPIRYVGFEIPDRFAIGYGLDHAERYRNLPYVAALEDQVSEG